MTDFKGHRFEPDIILLCVRRYLAYPLNYRYMEEMMAARGRRLIIRISYTKSTRSRLN